MSTTVAGGQAAPPATPRPAPPRPAPRRPGLGIVVTAIWAAFAIAAPTVIIYRHSRDNDGGAAKVGGDTVTMAQIAFKPTTLVVARGTKVSFVQRDASGGHGALLERVPDARLRGEVNDAFEYTCTIHPSMKAKVVLSG